MGGLVIASALARWFHGLHHGQYAVCPVGTSGFIFEFNADRHLQDLDSDRQLPPHRRDPVRRRMRCVLSQGHFVVLNPSLASIKELTLRESLTLMPLVALTILFLALSEGRLLYILSAFGSSNSSILHHVSHSP